jgi:LacI family transcriptional regulator
MKDIADDLGVSLMTVSKALRDHSDIAEETRRRIKERARELNYEPNLVARSLVSRRTFLIGLIVPDMMHSFFAQIAKGVDDKLEPLGYQIVICNSEESGGRELQQARILISRSVDGLIIAPAASEEPSALAAMMKTHEARYVLIDRTAPEIAADFVGVDDEEIGLVAARHLIEQQCRRIAHIRGPSISTGEGRFRGYRRALGERGLEVPEEYVVAGRDDATGYDAMQWLLRLDPRPDGVFGFNDPAAAGAMRAILEAGLRVPEDIAVVGVGDVRWSDLLRVPLSTVNQDSYQIGNTAAELLLDAMQSSETREPRRVLLPPRLVVRGSSLRTSMANAG